MALINTSVPNLIQGVSQQPDATRFDGQCEEQVNALSSVAEGLKKRPNTRHIAKLLDTAIDENSFVHFIDRSATEKYVVIHTGEALQTWNIITGTSCTINETTSYAIPSNTYLDAVSPNNSIKALTLADTTLLLNTSRIVAEDTALTDAVSPEALIFVKQGDYGTKYGASIQGNFTPTAGSAATATATLAENGNGTYSITGVTVGSGGGSGYEDGFVSLTASANTAITQQPQFNSVVSGANKISSVTVLAGGVIQPAPSGNTTTTHTAAFSNKAFNDVFTSVAGWSSGDYVNTYTNTLTFNVLFNGVNLLDKYSVGDSVTVNTGTNTIRVYNYRTYYNQSTPTTQYLNSFTGVVKDGSRVEVVKTYVYSVDVDGGTGGSTYKYKGLWFRGRSSDYAGDWSTNNSSFATTAITSPTYGTPTVSLTFSAPTTSTSVARVEADITTSTEDREELDSSAIAAALGAALSQEISNSGNTANFTVTSSNNLIVLTPNASSILGYTVSVSDGLSNEGLGLLYKEAASISDLPLYCKNGFKIKIVGTASESADDYYVEFKTNDDSPFGRGAWIETVGYNVRTHLAPNTLPHALISVSPNTFVISPLNGDTVTTGGISHVFDEWGFKTAGDDETNPSPAFVGSSISNLFFYKNRLGVLANENVIMSESGKFFNFFRVTVLSFLDSAPIEVSVASSLVTTLKAAVAFQDDLILFSDSGQFALKGGELLTPKTISINPITNFAYDSTVSPIPLGSYIYFPFTRGSFAGLREFTVNASTDNYDSSEVTEHVPAYIPSGIIDIKGSTSEDIIALLSANEKGTLYIYNYFWNNNQKILSAWSKFTFTGEIRGIEFIDSTLHMILMTNGQTHLVEMPMESGLADAAGYVTHLDMRVALTVPNGSSTITLPYTPADNTVQVYTTDGLSLNCTNSGATVTLSSPVSTDTDVWVGIPYTMKYTFSEQLFKAKAGNGKSPSNAAKLMIRNGSLYFDKSAYFKVKVTPKFRDTYENVFTPDVVGSSTLGSLSLDSGFYRFPVFTKAQDTTITIENESALPSTFQSAEFESFVHSRSNRYG